MTEADVKQLIDQDPGVATLVAKLAGCRKRLESESSHVRTLARKGTADLGLQRLRDDFKATKKCARIAGERSCGPIVIRQLQEQGESDKLAQGDEIEQRARVPR